MNQTFLGSSAGTGYNQDMNSTFTLPKVKKGSKYVFTIVLDTMGEDGNWFAGDSGKYNYAPSAAQPRQTLTQDIGFKTPRGILNYSITTTIGTTLPQSAITWKLTGNLGGEKYIDKIRGPKNEGNLPKPLALGSNHSRQNRRHVRRASRLASPQRPHLLVGNG
jgi:hypothetical protein